MRLQKKFLFEDDKLVLDIMMDKLPAVMTAEEVKQTLKDITKEARIIIGEIMASVKFKTIDLERQTFLVALKNKNMAVVIKLEAEADRDTVIGELERQGFVETD